MGFENEDVARDLHPDKDFPLNLSHNPERENYPWDRITDDERARTITYNEAIQKPVIVAGWGANMPLGHGGPAMCADHFAVVGKRLQVAPDRHSADRELGDQLLDRTFAATSKQLANLALTRFLTH